MTHALDRQIGQPHQAGADASPNIYRMLRIQVRQENSKQQDDRPNFHPQELAGPKLLIPSYSIVHKQRDKNCNCT